VLKTKGKKRRYQIIIGVIVIFALLFFIKRIPPWTKKTAPPEKTKILEPKITEEKKRGYKIAVIIDDVGYPSDLVEEYKHLDGKLTFSVLPFLKKSTEYATLLHDSGFEIMIHIPMEPQSFPQTDPGPGALLTGNTKEEVEQKISKMIDDIPFAVGANNHMGSRATADPDLMLWTMNTLKGNSLFFIDSVTTPDTLAHETALKVNLDSARRNVFLDNDDSFTAVNDQFEKLKKIARSNGTAIGIGHINKTSTLKVLIHQLPFLEEENYTLIFASEAIKSN
jgi:polysaccharide deacetylase 2 family uncharacterized protein YibQ